MRYTSRYVEDRAREYRRPARRRLPNERDVPESRSETRPEARPRARVVAAAHAVPGRMSQRDLWDGFFSDYYGGSRLARVIFRRSGVKARHGVANPLEEDLSETSTAERMERYAKHGLPLAREAIEQALQRAGLPPAEVGHLTLATCTGYTAPGVDVLVAAELGMDPALERLMLGHMGCYAALPALTAAADAVAVRQRPAVVLCLELTSLHVQPREEPPDQEQIVSHALFGDAATALVLEPTAKPGEAAETNPDKQAALEIVDGTVFTDTAGLSAMSWSVTDHGFRMGLSPKVPAFLGEHVGGVIGELLDRNGLSAEEVAAWAIHPGGPEIIDVVAQKLGLSEETVSASRRTLAEFGNCSSATVPLILEQILETPQSAPLRSGETVVAIAFGPGLTLHAALLRTVPA